MRTPAPSIFIHKEPVMNCLMHIATLRSTLFGVIAAARRARRRDGG